MFKAKIESVQAISGSDSVNTTILYTDGNREIRKSYNLHAQTIQSKTDVINFIQTECQILDKFYSLADIVLPLVNIDDVLNNIPND